MNTEWFGEDRADRRFREKSGVRVTKSPVVVDDETFTPFSDNPAHPFANSESQGAHTIGNAVPHLGHEASSRLVPKKQRPPVRTDEFHRPLMDKGKNLAEI